MSDKELVAEYRNLPNLDLQDEIAVLLYSIADAESKFVVALWQRRLIAAQHELQRRVDTQHLAAQWDAVGVDLDPQSSNLIPWLDLASDVRDRHAGIADIIRQQIPELKHLGHNWRGGEEYSCSCPDCGGDDRFRIWSGPPGRYWCRGCGLRGDIISAYRFVHPTARFRAALQALALECGVTLAKPDVNRRVQLTTDSNTTGA